MAHHDFTTPLTEAQARALRVNDTVTLRGTLFGIRDATQIHMFDRGRKTRFDLRGHAVIHTAPNVRKTATGYEPICVGTTTSARMERFTRPMMEQLGVRLIIGKGGLGPGSLLRRSLGLGLLRFPDLEADPRHDDVLGHDRIEPIALEQRFVDLGAAHRLVAADVGDIAFDLGILDVLELDPHRIDAIDP